MIDALVVGKIYGTPLERTAKNGNTYVTAKVRAPTRDGESLFINVVAFANTAATALLALEDGDSVALAGELTAKAYTSKEGAPKPSIELLAHQVLSEYAVQRKRQAAKPTGAESGPTQSDASTAEREFNDDIPF